MIRYKKSSIAVLCVIGVWSLWSPYWCIGFFPEDDGIYLEEGWNLVGWYQEYDVMASDLAGNITGCLSVSMWDASEQTYHTFIVGGPSGFDFVVSQGMGLFVDVTVPSMWGGC